MKVLLRRLKQRFIWKSKEEKIKKFILKNDFLSSFDSPEFVGIYISSWSGTFIPWYSVVLGLILKKFFRKNIVFIIDDLQYSTQELNPRYQVNSLKSIGAILSRLNTVVYLSKQPSMPVSEGIIKNFAYVNALHDLKSEKFDENNEYYKLLLEQLRKSSSKLISILEGFNFEYVVMPGGMCFLTGIFRRLLADKGVRCCSYDSGMKGTFLLSISGVAAHLDDVPKGVEYINKFHKKSIPSIKREVDEIIQQRFVGKDVFSSQLYGENESRDFTDSILLPLNINWDSAALDKHAIFESTIDWIVETARWVLENTENTIVIRQHPAERFSYAKGYDNYENILNESFGKNRRVIYIKAEDKVNTYEVLKQTQLVIVHTSTVAAEAAIYGKNVISVANSYHDTLGYVKKPKDKLQYFQYIDLFLKKPSPIEDKAYQNAIISYYVSQKLNWYFPSFLPSAGVDSWLGSDIDSIFNMTGTKEILEAIDTGTPLSIINYRELYNE
jgi:hypothetical protein